MHEVRGFAFILNVLSHRRGEGVQMPMEHETDLIAFLHEMADLRVKALTELAHQQADFKKVNQATLDFMESVKDNTALTVLMDYEDIKNEYISMIIRHLYIAGARDSLMLYGLLSKQLCSL